MHGGPGAVGPFLSQATSGPVRASGRPCPADPSPPQQRGSGRTVPPDLLYLALILGLGVSPMRRREFIALLGGGGGWALSGRAQQGAVPGVGYLVALFAWRASGDRQKNSFVSCAEAHPNIPQWGGGGLPPGLQMQAEVLELDV